MNPQGNSMRLFEGSAQIVSGGNWGHFAAAVAETLIEDVTISGIRNADGSEVAWALPAGTPRGVYDAPGSARNGGAPVFYKLGSGYPNSPDAAKVTVFCLLVT